MFRLLGIAIIGSGLFEGNKVNDRIVLFTGSQSLTGGTERASADVAKLLSDSGRLVTILSLYDGKSSKYETTESVTLHELYPKRPRGLIKALFATIRLLRYILKERPKAVISVESMSFLYLLPLFLVRNRPFIVNWEHFNADVTLGSSTRTFARRLSVLLADKIIVISDQDKELWGIRFNCPQNKIIRIYNVNPFNQNPQLGNIGFGRRDRIVVAAGRLSEQKGFDLLIEAWAKISSEVRNGWVLKIYGEGPDREKLAKMINTLRLEDEIKLAGYVPNIQKKYVEAQLFVLSSRFEGFGLVILEALTCGVPVVSFDCTAGPSEIIEDGVDGVLVPPEDSHALAAAIERLLSDDIARARFAEATRKPRKRFTAKTIESQWDMLLQSIPDRL